MYEIVTVFEGGRVELPPDVPFNEFVPRLLGVKVGKRAAFKLRRRSIFASDLVGAVEVGPLRIEVLPKPYGVDEVAEARAVMFNLLNACGSDARFSWFDGASSTTNINLLDLVEKAAADELRRRLHTGVPRRYQEVDENSSTVRGKVRFSQYARQLPSELHILPIRHSPPIIDNQLSRLLKSLAVYLRNRATSYTSRRTLDHCLDVLAGVPARQLTPALVAAVRLGRHDRQWSRLVEFSELLIAGQYPDPTSLGPTQQPTLLFPLNRLFELVVRRVLTRAMVAPFECTESPGEHRLLVARESNIKALAVRPDLLIRHARNPVACGDAKWKLLDESVTRHGVNHADIYQLLAYMRRFNTKSGLLFYPRVAWMPEDWSVDYAVEPGRTETITLVGVDLASLVASSSLVRKNAIDRLVGVVQTIVERNIV